MHPAHDPEPSLVELLEDPYVWEEPPAGFADAVLAAVLDATVAPHRTGV
jgi:hypothetical protein